MSSVWKLCLSLWDSSLSFSLSFSLLASQAGLAHHSPDHCLCPKDVGHEGVDALDAFFALGTVFGVTTEVGLALSSSVELSIDCIATSSAVDSPAAGAATAPPKVHVVS